MCSRASRGASRCALECAGPSKATTRVDELSEVCDGLPGSCEALGGESPTEPPGDPRSGARSGGSLGMREVAGVGRLNVRCISTGTGPEVTTVALAATSSRFPDDFGEPPAGATCSLAALIAVVGTGAVRLGRVVIAASSSAADLSGLLSGLRS